MGNQKEVRYVVSRLEDPSDPDGPRESIGWHPHLDLAKKHADCLGAGPYADAGGETYKLDGPDRRHGQWRGEWTSRNLYQGRQREAPNV